MFFIFRVNLRDSMACWRKFICLLFSSHILCINRNSCAEYRSVQLLTHWALVPGSCSQSSTHTSEEAGHFPATAELGGMFEGNAALQHPRWDILVSGQWFQEWLVTVCIKGDLFRWSPIPSQDVGFTCLSYLSLIMGVVYMAQLQNLS